MALVSLAGRAPAEMMQPRKLVDAHTAGILGRGEYDFECRVNPAGDTSFGTGLTLGIDVGVTDRLTIGLSSGGEGVVGRERRVRGFYTYVCWLVKYRIFEETLHFPGIAFGYDHQGHGGITDSTRFNYEGFIYKSPGFFVAMSKNFLLFNRLQFGIHGMCNFSLEEVRDVKWPNLIAGIDIGLNEELSAVFEYDFGFNSIDPQDRRKDLYARPSEGYLNAGLRWAFSPSFYLEFATRDLLEHRRDRWGKITGWGREIKLAFFSRF